MKNRVGYSPVRQTAAVSVALLLALVVICQSALAVQSGRKPPKRPPASDPAPSTSDGASTKGAEAPSSAPASNDTKPRVPVMVVKSYADAFNSAIYPGVVIEGCLDRLHEAGGVDARVGKDMNRKQASDFAKSSTDTYVVWIELQSDRTATSSPTSTMDPNNARSFYVNFVLFAPGSEKQKTSGHVYQRNRGPAGLPIPGGSTPNASTVEYSLRDAGRETANRVLDALGVGGPPGVIRN